MKKLPGIFELEEGEGRSLSVLEIEKDDLSVFVKQVFDVLRPDVRREIADVDPGFLVFASRHLQSFLFRLDAKFDSASEMSC